MSEAVNKADVDVKEIERKWKEGEYIHGYYNDNSCYETWEDAHHIIGQLLTKLSETQGDIAELEHENRINADVLATWRERALGAEAGNKRLEEELKRAVEALELALPIVNHQSPTRGEVIRQALQSIKGVDQHVETTPTTT